MSAQPSSPINRPLHTPAEYLEILMANNIPQERIEIEMVGWAAGYWMSSLSWIQKNAAPGSALHAALLNEAKATHNKFFGKYSAILASPETD